MKNLRPPIIALLALALGAGLAAVLVIGVVVAQPGIPHDPGQAEGDCLLCHQVGGVGLGEPGGTGMPAWHAGYIIDECQGCHQAATTTPTPTPTWTVTIDGLVQSPLSLTLDDLVAMPTSTVYAELICVGLPTSPIAVGNWTGVRLGYILEEAGVSPQAVKVAFYADDNFTTDLTVTTAMRHDIILAYERDGEPLTENLRLVVPCKWGYKWIRDLIHIELVDYDFLGYLESQGYSDEANIPGDIDCDGVADGDDNCPAWPNPGQGLPPWAVPANDPDCDGFTDADEGTIGTDPADNCPDDPTDDAWPGDFDMSTVINLGDLFNVLPPHFGSSPSIPDTNGDGIIDWSPRRDLVPSGVINLADVFLVLPPYFGASCTP